MDAPLLALTRRYATEPQPEDAAAGNMHQLVQLRWIAVAGQLFTILAVHYGLGVRLPLPPMLAVAALLALANLAGTHLARDRTSNGEIMLALLLDIGSLTAQLYLSGGATNPFISFYLLQLVLGAILLEMWSVWVLVAVTTLCFAGLARDSTRLAFPPDLLPGSGDLYMLGAWISFALTAALLGLFVTRITRNLRARDLYLADLRQQAAQEDGIVRMGLFASGAAHELGTPLATLSVILSDWRRLPHLAADPELAGDLAEMQAEVDRCKAIVTDILHSAGEPRAEAMESTAAADLLGEVVDDWRPTHPAVPLAYDGDGLEGARVIADPSFRQAIWSLLDNAGEVSATGIALAATRRGGELAVAVTDRGPGFTDAQLAGVGRPYQSSKGAGHGLGLFLATNVARRSGGRLEVANRADGGAEVTLILPLAGRQDDG